MTGQISKFNKLLNFLRKMRLANVLTSLLVTAIVVSSAATYLVIADPNMLGMGLDASVQSNLLTFSLGLLLVLALLISRKLIYLWLARDKKIGSRLLLRIVLMFSFVAIIPAIIVGLSSSFYLNMGIKSWFDERVSKAVVESVVVADAYLDEHKKVIQFDALNLANQIGNNSLRFAFSRERLETFLSQESSQRLLSDLIVFQKDEVIASSKLSFLGDPMDILKNYDINELKVGEYVILSYDKDKVIAVTSVNHATSSAARSSASEKIHQLADEVLDNSGVVGDALIRVAGFPMSAGPTSTVIGGALLQSVVVGTVAECLKRGIQPEIFLSSNLAGGDENNAAIFDKYRSLIDLYN
jgi:two-component system nitrogen regulation sensor histidine kinase NtrY